MADTVAKKPKSNTDIIVYSHKSLLDPFKVQIAEDIRLLGEKPIVSVYELIDSDFIIGTISVPSKKLVEMGKILKD